MKRPQALKYPLDRMKGRWRASFRLRLMAGFCGIILLVILITSVVMILQRTLIHQAAETRARAFTRTFAMLGAAAVLDNLFRIQEGIGRYLDDPEILELDVINSDNLIVAAKTSSRIGTVLNDPQWAPRDSLQDRRMISNRFLKS